MFKSKNSWLIPLTISILILLVFSISLSGNKQKIGLQYNKLTISQKDLDADLEELSKNKPLIEALKLSNTKFIVDNKIQTTYVASWVNIKLQALIYKDIRENENIKTNAKDLKAAETEAKKIFITGSKDITAEKIWDNFSADFKKRITDSFIDKSALIRTTSEISETEIKKYYVENNEKLSPKCESEKTISQIVVNSEKVAKNIIEKLKAGQEFSAIAKSDSSDINTSQNGGTLGCYTDTLLAKELNTTVAKLKVNEISKQIKYKNLYYIFKVTDSLNIKYESLKPDIKKIIAGINNKELLEKIESISKTAKIKVDSKYGYLSKQGNLPIISFKK